MRKWLERVGVKTPSIEPRSPCENGYGESFNGKLQVELLVHEVFDSLLEAARGYPGDRDLFHSWGQINTGRPRKPHGTGFAPADPKKHS